MWAAPVPLGNIATRYLSRVLGVRSGNTCTLEGHSEKKLKQNSSSKGKVGKKERLSSTSASFFANLEKGEQKSVDPLRIVVNSSRVLSSFSLESGRLYYVCHVWESERRRGGGILTGIGSDINYEWRKGTRETEI